MNFLLLVADPLDPTKEARAAVLQLQVLQTSPGGEDVTVSFRPNRSDDLYASAKSAAQLAYRILFGEGVIRSQLVVRFQVEEAPRNIVGRSADLLFALAIILRAFEESGQRGMQRRSLLAVAATGVLDPDGTVRAVDHLGPKLQAACRELGETPAAIFVPAENSAQVDLSLLSRQYPNLQFRTIRHLDEALEHLGMVLERVYLRNPFRGLEYFDYEHRAIFFGRDAEVRQVVEQLLRREANGAPGILVDGASGSGKSSFMRAGLLPVLVNPTSQAPNVQENLRARPLRDSLHKVIWRVGHLSRGANEEQFARSVLECWRALPEFGGRLPANCGSLTQLADERQKHWPRAQRFVWLIDQLEELFSVGFEGHLIDALGRFLLRLQAEGVWTLACIRADAVPQLKQHATMREVFGSNEGQYYLETMSGTALDDVINRPAQAAGLTFGLSPSGQRLDQLLREQVYATNENTLPLLQFTLQELYQQRSGNVLLFETYRQLGGLSGSVATAAENALAVNQASSERAIQRIFRSLVSVDDEGRTSKRYASVEEVASGSAERQLLERLVNARLCVTDQQGGTAVVAFAHEALLRTWPRLREWLVREGALLQARDILVAEARRWDQHAKQRDWLVTASDRLASIRGVVEADIPLPEIARQFARQSAMRARQATRLRQLAVVSIAVLAVMAVVFGLYAQHAKNAASSQRDAALQAQRHLLTESAAERLKDGDLTLARGILLEVFKQQVASDPPDPAAINVLLEISATDPAEAILSGHLGPIRWVTYSPDGTRILTTSTDHTARVWDAHSGLELLRLSSDSGISSARYSPDGTRIVTASKDTAQVWDAPTGTPLLLIRAPDGIDSAVYSPDGGRIATSFSNGVRLWDARTGARLAELVGSSQDEYHNASFSPDGSRIAIAAGRTALVWNAHSGAELLVLSGHSDQVNTVTYSPDGTRLLTSANDGSARVWDSRSGVQLLRLEHTALEVWDAAYSPDGRTIATAAVDKTVRLWDATTGKQLRVLSGHVNIVAGVAFSPDGTHLVSSAWDLTARTWDLRSRPDALVIAGHGDQVTSVAYSPDGTRLLTASVDKTARIWDARTGAAVAVLSGHTKSVGTAVYSPDGTRVLTASDDKSIRIWDARSGEPLIAAATPEAVQSAAYSPDGRHIVASYADGTFGIRDGVSGVPTGAIKKIHRDYITSTEYSPDGARIVTASVDKTVRVWDAQSLDQLLVIPHKDFVYDAVYSPNGQLILTAAVDSLAHIFNARTGEELRVLTGHHHFLGPAAFSFDGQRIVTGSFDQTVRIWDTQTGTQLADLMGHHGMVNGVCFSPDGKHVASASADNTARIWDATIPANWHTQLLWEQAAEADPLAEVGGTLLGVSSTMALLVKGAVVADPPKTRPATAARASRCAQQAGAYYDPDGTGTGVEQSAIDPDLAVASCAGPNATASGSDQLSYLAGRALLAKGDVAGARRELESAVSHGYRAARVDLALLLTDPEADMLDAKRAASLLRQAWESGIAIAGFELGALYERGVAARARRARTGWWQVEPASLSVNGLSASQSTASGWQTNPAEAWHWYQAAARRSEPHALARLAERAEREVNIGSKPDAELLSAFTLYARAAERARQLEWPDNVWRSWRYRRATLAHLLARAGLIEQVASAYEAVLAQQAAP